MSEDLAELQRRHQNFVEERDWDQFHTPKSIAMAISIEANELLEQFQWHDNLPVSAYQNDTEIEAAVEEETADVIIYCLSMASEFDIDVVDAIETKLEANEERFDQEESARIQSELSRWKDP